MGGEAALVECHVLYGIGVEYREHAEHVVHVIHRDTVKQQQVLVRITSADIQPGCGLGPSHHSGEQLEGFQDIGLSEHGGDGLDLFNGDIHSTHLGASHSQYLAVSHNSDLIKLLNGPDIYIYNGVRFQCEGERERFVAHIAGAHLYPAVRKRERVESVFVGYGSTAAVQVKHCGSYQCLFA